MTERLWIAKVKIGADDIQPMRKLYLRSCTDSDVISREMGEIGVCQEGIDIMAPKSRQFIFMARDLDPRAANILKQEMLAVGGDAAISYHAISDLTKETDAHIIGTERQISIANEKLKCQPFGLKELAAEIECALNNLARPLKSNLNCGGKELAIGERSLIMGVLNVTPDSFSDGGQFLDKDAAINHARTMIEQGADIIDVGGESTRPGAEPVSAEIELERVIPVIKALSGNILLSIDTRKPEVARKAIEAGACMVNLVGGIRDEETGKLIAEKEIPAILMHMLGEPASMQTDPQYDDVMDDIAGHLADQIETAIGLGIKAEKIIVDPGIGFGKTTIHNLEIMKRLGELRILGCPILIGASRKSFIGKITGAEANDRLEGSLAAAVLAAAKGAHILRVHDVKETKRALAVADSIIR